MYLKSFKLLLSIVLSFDFFVFFIKNPLLQKMLTAVVELSKKNTIELIFDSSQFT